MSLRVRHGGGFMYRIKGIRKVVVLCTLVTYCFTKGSPKTEPQIRKKIFIQKKKQPTHNHIHKKKLTPHRTLPFGCTALNP